MKQYRDCQIYSTYACRAPMSRISMFDVTMHCYQQVRLPQKIVLEGLYRSKLQDSVQLQTVLALYDHSKQWPTELFKDWRRLWGYILIDQTMRTWNFRAQNEIVERGATSKSEEGKKPYVERRVGECFQWKANGQCSKRAHVDSPMILHLGTDARIRQEKDNRPLLHLIQRQRLTGKNPSTDQTAEVTALGQEGADSRAEVKTRHGITGILPYVRVTSQKQDAVMATRAAEQKIKERW